MIDVDTSSFFAIVLVAAIAAITVAIVPKRYAPPVVVLELIMGIVIGPQVLGLAHSDNFIEFFSNLGLGMLFYFAGYEIDFERIKGRPMKLGAWGWLLSVALAYGIGGHPRRGRDRRLLPLHRLGDGDDGDRHADPDPARQRRAEDQVRHLPAGGRRRRRVRADPAGDPGPVHRQPPARVGDPARLRRPGADPRDGIGPLRLARLAGAGKDLRGEQPARGADHRRARLRPGPAGEPARPRRPARRLRRRDDHQGGAARGTSCRSSSRS